MDLSFSSEDAKACVIRNRAAKNENAKRLRAAESTAKWVCPTNKFICKWEYKTVALAEEEDCGDKNAGLNHKILAHRARDKANVLKERVDTFDTLVAELTIKLEDAKARITRAFAKKD